MTFEKRIHKSWDGRYMSTRCCYLHVSLAAAVFIITVVIDTTSSSNKPVAIVTYNTQQVSAQIRGVCIVKKLQFFLRASTSAMKNLQHEPYKKKVSRGQQGPLREISSALRQFEPSTVEPKVTTSASCLDYLTPVRHQY